MSKQEVYNRDGGECFYCGTRLTMDEATTEHLLATVHGGSNKDQNLAIACRVHNNEAGAKSVVEKVKLREAMRASTTSAPVRSNRAVVTSGATELLQITLWPDCPSSVADGVTKAVINMLEAD